MDLVALRKIAGPDSADPVEPTPLKSRELGVGLKPNDKRRVLLDAVAGGHVDVVNDLIADGWPLGTWGKTSDGCLRNSEVLEALLGNFSIAMADLIWPRIMAGATIGDHPMAVINLQWRLLSLAETQADPRPARAWLFERSLELDDGQFLSSYVSGLLGVLARQNNAAFHSGRSRFGGDLALLAWRTQDRLQRMTGNRGADAGSALSRSAGPLALFDDDANALAALTGDRVSDLLERMSGDISLVNGLTLAAMERFENVLTGNPAAQRVFQDWEGGLNRADNLMMVGIGRRRSKSQERRHIVPLPFSYLSSIPVTSVAEAAVTLSPLRAVMMADSGTRKRLMASMLETDGANTRMAVMAVLGINEILDLIGEHREAVRDWRDGNGNTFFHVLCAVRTESVEMLKLAAHIDAGLLLECNKDGVTVIDLVDPGRRVKAERFALKAQATHPDRPAAKQSRRM